MNLARLAHMDVDEITWRARAAARIAWDRIRVSRAAPAWNRAELAAALAGDAALDDARSALDAGRWRDAHRALGFHIAFTPQRFALAASNHSTLARAIRQHFPRALADATARAEDVLSGRYDLLGYRGLTFQHAGADVDWQLDPVHGREAPRAFWSDVPYLDPKCGDHKIIWELNRHQHWLALGRAFWLTGDVRYRQRCLHELASWMAANPPLTGINWASMLELGLRCISWLWALAFFADLSSADEAPWIVDLLLGMDRQLTHVERNLSYYFSPNTHLLGEALALYVCGRALPLLRGSRDREDTGRRILLDEARRQIASRISRDRAAGEFAGTVSRLADAARVLADDRGELPLFGDDDGGMLFPMTGRPPRDIRDSLAVASVLLDRPELRIGPVPEEAYWLLAHPSFGDPERATPRSASGVGRAFQAGRSTALRDTGYYVSRSGRGDHLVIDGGVHGYLNGGHAHADALSLTLTVAGVPLLVDPGTGVYTVDQALRDRLRSSQMHNTLVVDGRSQSITKGPFSWTTMARGRVRRWKTHKAFDYFEGTHDGYFPIEHRRHVLTLPGDLMVVADLVTGGSSSALRAGEDTGGHTASVHWHIDPRWRVAVREEAVTFSTDAAQCQLAVPRGHIERFEADAATGLGWQAPVYGAVEPSTSLRVTHCDRLPFWMVSVFGLHRDNAVVEVEFLPVSADAGALSKSLALRIVRHETTDFVLLAEPAAARPRTTWRAGEIETDARVLFCRERDDKAGEVAMLDGSRVKVHTNPPVEFESPHRVDHIHLSGA